MIKHLTETNDEGHRAAVNALGLNQLKSQQPAKRAEPTGDNEEPLANAGPSNAKRSKAGQLHLGMILFVSPSYCHI
jgi:hypothetical protein